MDQTMAGVVDKRAPYANDEVAATYRKVSWRVVTFLFVGYLVAYLDRINVGFAQLQMQHDLGFSDAVYGLGAGIFFAGYFLFEVPSNLMLEKIGVRKTMMRVLICWGVVSACMRFISSPIEFYVMRFMLGVFEAGFVPGAILYLTYWYPETRRARMLGIFSSAITIAGVIGSPVSGAIMTHLAGVYGMAGWQWLFVLEGIPAVVLGLLVPYVLVNRPRDATWLTHREKDIIEHHLASERGLNGAARRGTFGDTLKDPRIYLLAFVYFAIICGIYAVSFWLPTIIKNAGVKDVFDVGLYSTIPYGIGALGMIFISRHSDMKMERRWHLAGCVFIGGAALVMIAATVSNLTLALVAFAIATATIFTGMPLFFALLTSYLSGTAAAGGIALLNSLALLGGFVSPAIMAWAKTTTGSFTSGLYILAALQVLAGLVVVLCIPVQALRGTGESAMGEMSPDAAVLEQTVLSDS
ncbi:MFS transporter [Paraburkholderia fungorum]|uniref:MFS transporter n=1 Tax=Paraburkholderia fungorum TaxID=134537 RepID=UPI0038BA70FD